MSYNIDRCKVKKCNNVTIPIDAIIALPYVETDTKLGSNDVLIYGPCEGFKIKGTIDSDVVRVSEMDFYGEGSGHEWDAIKDMLSKSSGEFEAVLVWEGGDSITRITVNNGVVSEENVDI